MIKVITFDLDGVYFLKGKENFIVAFHLRGGTDTPPLAFQINAATN